jgi:hypothetical protein
LHLRVFVSSPGDVRSERELACGIVRDMQGESAFRGKVTLEPVAWDDKQAPSPMEANRTPQASVDDYVGKPSGCDLMILVLGGRIGSPLRFADGREFPSGTVYEFEDAIAAQVPVFAYRHKHPRIFDIADSAELRRAKEAQYEAVVEFFERRFSNADGALTGGYTAYAEASEFAGMLRQNLATFIRRRLDGQPESTGAAEKPYLVPATAAERRFIGRTADLERLWRQLEAGRSACIMRLAGVGKTALALKLASDRARLERHFAGVLWADLGPRPDLLASVQAWARELGVNKDGDQRLSSIDDWKEVVRTAISTRRLLIVLDDVWLPAHALEFLQLAPRAVVVMTTRRSEVAAELMQQDEVFHLPEMTSADGLELLTHIAPKAVQIQPDEARELVDAVQGLPIAIVLMGRYLYRESLDDEPDPDRVKQSFDALREAGVQMTQRHRRAHPPAVGGPHDEERSIAELLEVSVQALASDELRERFADLSIFRPKPHAFTKKMAREICGMDDPLPVFAALHDIGLIESRGAQYSMHPIIRSFAQQRLSGQRRAELDASVLCWHGDRLSKVLSADEASFAGWYRYENPEWQAAMHDWLYYLAASGDTRGSMLAFLRVYCDAFWWWGFFEPFPFCRRLVDEWLSRAVGPVQRAGLLELKAFQDAYPYGISRRGTAAQWIRCEAAVVRIRALLGMDGAGAPADSVDARRVRGITDFLLAECEAYGRGDLDAAVARLRAAHARFVADGDPWVPGYLSYYLAHMELEAGRPELARAHLERGFVEANETLPLAKRDCEQLSNLHRASAELAMHEGDTEQATAAFARAAAYAFAFQAVPGPADTYSVRYFEFCADRIATTLLALWLDDAPAARRMGQSLRATWTAWWQRSGQPDQDSLDIALASNDPARVRRHLFPTLPPLADMLANSHTVAAEVNCVLGDLRHRAGLMADAVPELDR